MEYRTEIDIRNEKIGYKIREHCYSKIPIIIAIGKKEAEERICFCSSSREQETKTIKLDEIKNILQQESKIPSINMSTNLPFLQHACVVIV